MQKSTHARETRKKGHSDAFCEANGVKAGYQNIEDSVVDGYQAIEDAVVGTYKKIEGKFVEKFLEEVPKDEE